MALTKADLIETIHYSNDLTKKKSTDIVESTINIIKDILATGDDQILSARRVVTFKCSGKLKERVNGS